MSESALDRAALAKRLSAAFEKIAEATNDMDDVLSSGGSDGFAEMRAILAELESSSPPTSQRTTPLQEMADEILARVRSIRADVASGEVPPVEPDDLLILENVANELRRSSPPTRPEATPDAAAQLRTAVEDANRAAYYAEWASTMQESIFRKSMEGVLAIASELDRAAPATDGAGSADTQRLNALESEFENRKLQRGPELMANGDRVRVMFKTEVTLSDSYHGPMRYPTLRDYADALVRWDAARIPSPDGERATRETPPNA